MEKIKLTHPVLVGGVTISELPGMRRPKVRDMLLAQKTTSHEADCEVVMFGNLCEVERAVIEELEMVDYLKLQETYRGFLSTAPPMPEKPA